MLSDVKVRNAKPKGKQYKLSDCDGMYILVTPSGGKCWRLNYRWDGKQKTLALGTYPEISLGEARTRKDDARKLLANGVDPIREKREKKAEEVRISENTFKKIFEEWFEQYKDTWVESHRGRIQNRINFNIPEKFQDRPISDIDAPEVLLLLRLVQSRSLETAHRVKFTLGQIFRYAIATGHIKHNPVDALRGALPPIQGKNYAAIIDPRDIGPMLRAFEGYSGGVVVKSALLLLPLVFLRPGELRQGEWSEVDFMRSEWNVPGERMKMKKSHIVPLSKQAIAILQWLYQETGDGKYMFPSHRSRSRYMSDNAVNAAIRSMGFSTQEQITGHGFRAMARTVMRERLHVDVEFLEIQLAHLTKSPNGTAYDRVSFLPERREMMQAWADYLDSLKDLLSQSRFEA